MRGQSMAVTSLCELVSLHTVSMGDVFTSKVPGASSTRMQDRSNYCIEGFWGDMPVLQRHLKIVTEIVDFAALLFHDDLGADGHSLVGR